MSAARTAPTRPLLIQAVGRVADLAVMACLVSAVALAVLGCLHFLLWPAPLHRVLPHLQLQCSVWWPLLARIVAVGARVLRCRAAGVLRGSIARGWLVLAKHTMNVGVEEKGADVRCRLLARLQRLATQCGAAWAISRPFSRCMYVPVTMTASWPSF